MPLSFTGAVAVVIARETSAERGVPGFAARGRNSIRIRLTAIVAQRAYLFDPRKEASFGGYGKVEPAT